MFYKTDIFLLVCCAFCMLGAFGKLTSHPSDMAAAVGQSVSLSCSTAPTEVIEPFSWQYNPLKSSTPIPIVFDCQVNPAYVGRYTVDKLGNNRCNLIISNVNMDHAGTYICQHGYDEASADLVTLSSHTACTYTPSDDITDGDLITVRCSASYNGTRPPKMTWQAADTGSPITNATTNTFPNEVNTVVHVPVYAPRSRPITCATFFDAPIAYQSVWTLPTINVQYFATSVMAKVKVTHFENTILTCSADGYPAPSFVWTNVNTGQTTSGDTVHLGSAGSFLYSCEASNTVRGETRSVRTRIGAEISELILPEDCITTASPTTTTEPTTQSTTTPGGPVGGCGRLMYTVPPGEISFPANYSQMCYITSNDTALLSTPCRDLLVDLPPDYADYNDLLQRGGDFGCYASYYSDYTNADRACFDDYQQDLTLSSCIACVRMYVCIRFPSSIHKDSSQTRIR